MNRYEVIFKAPSTGIRYELTTILRLPDNSVEAATKAISGFGVVGPFGRPIPEEDISIVSIISKPCYFANDEYVDTIYNGSDPICMGLTEVDQLARSRNMTTEELLAQMHDASDDEISWYGVQEE